MIIIKLSYKSIYVFIFFILSIFEQQLWKKIIENSFNKKDESKKMKYVDMNLIFFISFIKIFSIIFFYIENYYINNYYNLINFI